jgi:LacI family transcriptional regulator
MIIPAPTHNVDDDFFSILIKGVSYAAAQHQYDLLVSAVLPETDEMSVYRRVAGGRRVDGLIVARTHRDDPRIGYLKAHGHPFVVAGRLAPDDVSDFPYIDADSETGLRVMVEHFADYGHRRIGLVLPPQELAYTPYRLTGYREGLAAAGLPYEPDYVVSGDLTYQSGYRAGESLLDRLSELTAVIACNDLMALGVMAAVQDHGMVVGTDIAVGGFDDIPAAEHASPSLTTIRQPILRIGEELASMLVAIIGGETMDNKSVLIEPELAIRESSGQRRS